MPTIVELLGTHPFTSGMSAEHLKLLADCGRLQEVDVGEYVLREGEPADSFFLVIGGRVAIELFAPNRGAITVQTVSPGEVIGWSWLFEPYRFSFDARAMEPSQLIALNALCVRGKTGADHALAVDLLSRMARVLAKRLTAARVQLMDIYGSTPQ